MIDRSRLWPRARHTGAAAVVLTALLLNPASPAAEETLSIQPRPSNADQVELRWTSQVGRSYAISNSTNLSGEFGNLSTGLQATPPENSWWTDADTVDREFFRLVTETAVDTPASLLINGGFEDGKSGWITVVNAAVDATLSVVNGEMVANIISGGTPPQLQLMQKNLPLTNGHGYTLVFDARSIPGVRDIQVRFTSTNSPGQIQYFQNNAVPLSPSMSTYTVSFTMLDPTDPFARVVFNLGGNTNDVVIDNVVLFDGILSTERADSSDMVRRLATGNNFMAAKAIQGRGAPEDYTLLNQYHFSHCRIGYKLDEMVGPPPNYALPASELQQLQDLVDYCLAEGLIAIVDPVHNWANGPGYTHPADLPKLQRIWDQVAAHFEDYPEDRVAFEIMNEPHNGASVSNIIATGLAAIRAYAGNAHRQVIVSGEGFSTRQALINAFDNDWIPADDPYLIGTFHYYDPRAFTKQGDPGGPLTNVFWGSPGDVAQINSDFEAVTAANNAWALRNGTEALPVYLGEFGVDNFATTADRKRWLARVRMAAEQHGFACAHWNMYANEPDNKGMGPWTTAERDNPALRTFDAAPAEALITRYEAEAGPLNGGVSPSASQAGFSGAGYAQYPAGTGANVYCQINGYIPTDDTYTVEIHYASVADRTLRLQTLNNASATVDDQNVVFPTTGGPDSWATLKVHLDFQAGENARLRLIADTDPGPAIDHVRFTR